MDKRHHDGEREIFEASLELPPSERTGFLRQACGDDHDLEARIHRLLLAHERATEAATGPTIRPQLLADDEPEHIGPYRIVERVGEGGMGSVFLAEQTRPIRRRVAIKLIKLGMDTKEVIARFDSERQALALMDHPSIARILDAGATDRGRPYFVMEYVPGTSIIKYCDSKQLGMSERLGLFVEVCRAVQHAHQKGVIHRDLKPSNILITEDEGRAVPKVIDFGVAKATNRRLSDLTVYTELGCMIGTPEYMSPEQAEMTALDVDTRSDVYSLGVVLYELLVGVRPFELSDKNLLEIQRVICEKEPEPPSSRARKLDDGGAMAGGGGSPVTPWRRLRGELDWITLSALSKDRRRRYQTALALASDIERYLNHEPVYASSPSATYRLVKFIRRHSLAAGAGSVAVALVMTLVAFYTFQLAQERDRASRQADRANQEAKVSGQVTEFLVELFGVSDPSEARGNTVTAREILDKGADRITQELTEQPEVQARLMETIGRVYQSLGLYDKARPLLERALELRRQTLEPEHIDVAKSLSSLGMLLFQRGDYEEAELLHREALAMQRRLIGQENEDVANSVSNLALTLHYRGDHEAAEPLFREALVLWRKLLGEEHEDVALGMNNLALLLFDMGDYDAAEPLYRDALAIKRKVLGNEHPSVVNTLNNLALLLEQKGNLEAAESLSREALAMRRKLLGEEHPDVAVSLNNLAVLLQRKGDYEEAESFFGEALAMKRKLLGDETYAVAISLNNLAVMLQAKGDCDAAEPFFREALDIFGKTLDPDHWIPAQVRSHYGACLTTLARYREAEQNLLAGLDGLRGGLGDEHERTLKTVSRLVGLYEAWGRPGEAAKYRAPGDDP